MAVASRSPHSSGKGSRSSPQSSNAETHSCLLRLDDESQAPTRNDCIHKNSFIGGEIDRQKDGQTCVFICVLMFRTKTYHKSLHV